MYAVDIMPQAEDDLKRLRKNEPKAFQKALKLINELLEHPQTGTGKPERLSGNRAGQWSRRITDKHRLIYAIHDETVVVLVLAAYGHYEDK